MQHGDENWNENPVSLKTNFIQKSKYKDIIRSSFTGSKYNWDINRMGIIITKQPLVSLYAKLNTKKTFSSE